MKLWLENKYFLHITVYLFILQNVTLTNISFNHTHNYQHWKMKIRTASAYTDKTEEKCNCNVFYNKISKREFS